MISNDLINFKKEKSIFNKIAILLIALFPASLLSGSLIINISLVLIGILYIIQIISNKNIDHLNNFYFYLLIFFSLGLLINIFLNTGDNFSYERQISFLRYVFFVFALNYFLKLYDGKYFSLVLKTWIFIFLIVTFDIIFEYIFGFNVFGYKSYMPGRIASFLNDELKIGNFFYGLCFIFLAYTTAKFKNFYNILIIILIILISFMIGERSNFIKVFLGCILFVTFVKNFDFKFKIIIPLICLVLISNLSYMNKGISDRIKSISGPVMEQGLLGYIKTSHYGVHYETAYQIFLKNKFFGIGLKQFRYESSKEIYKNNPNNIYQRDNWATHPHQIHFEILSETGIFGYLIFLIFFFGVIIKSLINFFKNKNLYLLASIIFIVTSFIPILPSGSFFTTYSAAIFWLNFSMITVFSNDNKKF